MAADDKDEPRRGKCEKGEEPRVSIRFSLGVGKEWAGAERDGRTASRDQIVKCERG